MGKWVFPDYTTKPGKDYDDELRDLAYEGLKKKGIKETPEIRERIEYELKVIRSKGYSPYFLVTADLLLSTGAVNPDGMMGLALYLAGMGSTWYDFARNLIWAIDGSDPDQMARNFAIPRWSVVATASALSAVGLWRLWVNGRRVFWDADPSGKESKLTIMPMTSPESFGVWAEVRF